LEAHKSKEFIMRRIESIEDEKRGVVTYQIDADHCITLDAHAVREYGLELLLQEYGVELPTERVPVYQRDRMIGTVPAMFDPLNIKSTSFLYDPRVGDFKREGDKWVAARNLGPGDFDAIEGFERHRAPTTL
jgi:hypothetical protein